MVQLGFAKVDDQGGCRTKIVDDQGGCRTKIVDDQGGCRTKLELMILIFMHKYTFQNCIFIRHVDTKCSVTPAWLIDPNTLMLLKLSNFSKC